ncbi:MAG TPA: glycosyltransferase family 39 protein [Gemmatimonadales bacterium]|nr:glycosyltransferase family 39 protein [Gemmatimonadales bacterium]
MLTRPGSQSPSRLRLPVGAALVALFLVAAARTPLLTDEMYYWDWSRHLASGYFDHPPAIAWLIRAGTLVAGDTPFGVRLASVLCGFGAIALLDRSTRLIGAAEDGQRLLLIIAGLPLVTASFLLATPDAPFLAATAALLFCTLRALRSASPGPAICWWMAAGAALGMGLLSKYTALLIPAGVVLALLIDQTLRRQLLTPGPYLALVVAALVTMPVVVWNAQHDWVSLRFQLLHGLGASMGGNTLGREFSFLGGQLAIANPVMLALLAWSCWRAARNTSAPVGRTLGILALAVFGFFMISASRRPVEANWPAPAYLPAALVLAVTPLGAVGRRWLGIGAGLAVVLMMVALLHLITPVLPLAREVDQVAEAHGWPAVADSASAVQGRAEAGGRRVFLAGNRYQETGAMAWHMKDHPTVYSLNVDYRPNQYDYWPRFEQVAGAGNDLLLVIEPGAKGDSVVARLLPSFDQARMVMEVERRRGSRVLTPRDLWLFEGWKGEALPRGITP